MFEELLRHLGIGGDILPGIAHIMAPDPLALSSGMAPKSAEAQKNSPMWMKALGGPMDMLPMIMQQMQGRQGTQPMGGGMPAMVRQPQPYQAPTPQMASPYNYSPLGG